MKELQEKLHDLRTDQDIKQNMVAAYLGIKQQTYSNYENGRRDVPTWVVTALAKYYKVSTDYLLGADTSYLGNTNLKTCYVDDVTMHDVMYSIQKLKVNVRKDLLKYIQYLEYVQNLK